MTTLLIPIFDFENIPIGNITAETITAVPGGSHFVGPWTFDDPLNAVEVITPFLQANEALVDIIALNPTTPPIVPYPFNFIWLPTSATHPSFGQETFAFLSDIPATPSQSWISLQPFVINPGGVDAATTIWLETGDTRPSYGSTELALLSDVISNLGYLDLNPFAVNPGDADTIWQEIGQPRPNYGALQIAMLTDIPPLPTYLNLDPLAVNPGDSDTIWQQIGQPRPGYGLDQLALISDLK